jgi:hypothetical protein
MITVIPNLTTPASPHVLQLLRRTGIAGITATAWCQQVADGGDGLLQVPEGKLAFACPACKAAIEKYEARQGT